MKKFITIIFAVIIATVAFSINVNGQNGEWDIYYEKADELTDTPACYTNLYAEACNGGHNLFGVSRQGDVTLVMLRTDKGIFDCRDGNDYASIYFYKGDKLVEKIITNYIQNKKPDTVFTFGCNTNGKMCLEEKILNHIKNIGSVRITARKIGAADFDLTIPMNPNVK